MAGDRDLGERAAQLMAVSGRQGFNAWLGVELDEADAEAGRLVLHVAVRPDMTQHHGFVHGGIVGSLADTAMSWVAALTADDVVTQSYALQLLAPAKGPILAAERRIIRAGRQAIAVEARVRSVGEDGAEALVATGLGSIWRVGARKGG